MSINEYTSTLNMSVNIACLFRGTELGIPLLENVRLRRPLRRNVNETQSRKGKPTRSKSASRQSFRTHTAPSSKPPLHLWPSLPLPPPLLSPTTDCRGRGAGPSPQTRTAPAEQLCSAGAERCQPEAHPSPGHSQARAAATGGRGSGRQQPRRRGAF